MWIGTWNTLPLNELLSLTRWWNSVTAGDCSNRHPSLLHSGITMLILLSPFLEICYILARCCHVSVPLRWKQAYVHCEGGAGVPEMQACGGRICKWVCNELNNAAMKPDAMVAEMRATSAYSTTCVSYPPRTPSPSAFCLLFCTSTGGSCYGFCISSISMQSCNESSNVSVHEFRLTLLFTSL